MPESSTTYIAKIKSFHELQPNWDTYGGLPITELASERALSIIRALSLDETKMPCVVWPDPDGGIEMTWCTLQGDELWLFIRPDATLEYCYADGREFDAPVDAWVVIDDIKRFDIPAVCSKVH